MSKAQVDSALIEPDTLVPADVTLFPRERALLYRAWCATHEGLRRDHNEDAHFLDPDGGIFAIADGMGGHRAGDVAARMVMDEIRRQRDVIIRAVELFRRDTGEVGRRRLMSFIPSVIQHANRLVHQASTESQRKRGMGTTVLMVVAVDEHAFVCHVGDSRLYLYRKRQLHQLTQDHSQVARLLERGHITPEQARKHPRRAAILRAVGIHPEVEVDTLYLDSRRGDRLLLCTDGLTDMVAEHDLESMMRKHRGEALVKRAVVAANHAGGHDNITALAVEVFGAGMFETTPRMEMLEKLSFIGGLSLFSNLNAQERIKVNRILYERRFVQGDVIIRAGDWGDEIFIVVDGSVGIWKGERKLRSVARGGHFGELGVISQERRSATVVAEGHCLLFCVHQDDFLGLSHREPVLGNKILMATVRQLAARVQDLTARLSEDPD